MAFIGVGIGLAVVGAGAQVAMSLQGRTERRNAANDARTKMLALEEEYKNLDTTNLASTIKNRFEDMENTFEDMTVNQQQARFQAQQFQQTQTNIMQNLQGAAGGSGIAALAQTLANQGQLAAQQSSASIGMQESQIQKLQATEASKIQQMERAGAAQVDAMQLQGAETARSLEYQKTGTRLGMAQQELGAANQAIAEARAQQIAAVGGLVSAGGQIATAGIDQTEKSTGKYGMTNAQKLGGSDKLYKLGGKMQSRSDYYMGLK